MAVTELRHSTVRHVPMGLREALVRYERWRLLDAKFSTQTWAGEKAGLLNFVDYMLRRDVEHTAEVTHDLVSDWWHTLRLADATRTTRLAQLRSFLGYCLKRGWLLYDPSALLRAPRPAALPRERLDAAELLALPEQATNPRDRALLALATNLAVRGMEIARLRVRDVNLGRSEIVVRIDKTTEVDVMPITYELGIELAKWLLVYNLVPGFSNAAYLIPKLHLEPTHGRYTYYPSEPIRRPYEVVKRALTAMGWESVKQEGVHTVRRSMARVYFDDVCATPAMFDSALLATMELLHHARPETTLQYIGRDRQKMARDMHLAGKPFLSRLAGNVTSIRAVQ